ncbi:SSU ribosomal protein S27mt, mitochondrial [Thermococcus nautili]|uniref:hypothetical protein n=1 Tax=Thermococcus nautili TaxID=195522 RepID=UPI002557855C|nr:hypothetical protein [Thermococcus nautili]CAI1492054.1 SSU ribosomal protein S27mt, mitochondrial [Thermococcus nautili]
MASDVRTIEMMLKTDEKARRSVSEWIVQLAKKIHEKPEDIVWFFEMQQRMREIEEKAKRISDEELERWEKEIEKELENSEPVRQSLETLMKIGERSFRKFKRIEVKLRELGVV